MNASKSKITLEHKKDSLFFGPNEKEIKILNYFRNGDKTITNYMNSNNQEFDRYLFNVLFLKKYLMFKGGPKYNGLSAGEKYSFRHGTNYNIDIMTTSEGDSYLKSELNNQPNNFISNNPLNKLIGNNPLKKMTDNIIYPYQKLYKALDISNNTLNKILGISDSSKNIGLLNSAFGPIKHHAGLFKELYSKEQFNKFKEIMDHPLNIKTYPKKQAMVLDVNLRSKLKINLQGYELLYRIENKIRDELYNYYNLNEDNDFEAYLQFSNKLGVTNVMKKGTIVKINKLDLIKERQLKEKENVYLANKDYRLIDYFDLEELIKFIDNSIFKNINKEDRTYLRFIVKDFANVRKKIAHSRLISENELNTYKKLYDILLKLEENPNESN